MKFFLDIKRFFVLIFRQKSAVYELAKRDFQAQNKDTYLGIIWGYIQPLTYILLLVLVFTIGLRTNPGGKVPFVVYLITGMIPWQFFVGTLTPLTQVVKAHSFLVKKGDFSLSILHVAKLLSSLVPHLVLLLVTIIFCWFHGLPPGFYTLQLIYYLTMMFIFLLGLGWISSSTSLFVPDVANVITIITQFGFWLTPIIWNIERVPPKYQWIVKLNPMCYIVNGYRDSLIHGKPWWTKPQETLYFWVVTVIILLAGVVIFRRLKPHFGEVI